MSYQRKTKDRWDIMTNWGYGWECENSEYTRADAKRSLKEYRENLAGRADVRAVLKKHGFKWAPSQGAWQRMLNPAGKYALNRVKEELEVMQNDN